MRVVNKEITPGDDLNGAFSLKSGEKICGFY